MTRRKRIMMEDYEGYKIYFVAAGGSYEHDQFIGERESTRFVSTTLRYLKQKIRADIRDQDKSDALKGTGVVFRSAPRTKSGKISSGMGRSRWYYGTIVSRRDTGETRHYKPIYTYKVKVKGWKKPWDIGRSYWTHDLRLADGPHVAAALNKLEDAERKAKHAYEAEQKKYTCITDLTTTKVLDLVKKAA